RYAASSVLVENKLYFFGGYIGGKCSNEVFYLDLSRSFNLATPPWIDLTLNAKIPFRSCWGTVSLNNKEQIIYLFGGLNLDDLNQNVFVSSIHSFNLNSLSWNVPNIKGIKPNRRANIQSVIDNSGIMYIFGGYTGPSLGTGTTFDYNDMVILNTVELSWANNIINPPNPRDLYTATLLSSGVIQIILYDTKSLTWSERIAKTSSIIDNRAGHTAVLAPNGRIIIYGGSKDNINVPNLQVVPDIFVLNMETEQFELTVPPVTSNIGKVPPSLSYHTTNLADNYMIVAFGNITQPNSVPLPLANSNIYIMDIRNYTWVNSFELITKPEPSPPKASIIVVNSNSESGTMKIIIASIGGIVVAIIIIACVFLIYRWNENRKILSPKNINEEHTLPGHINEEHTLPGEIVEKV
ncbi:3153_t:CDS:2, partial [Funneliformis geosporum]